MYVFILPVRDNRKMKIVNEVSQRQLSKTKDKYQTVILLIRWNLKKYDTNDIFKNISGPIDRENKSMVTKRETGGKG